MCVGRVRVGRPVGDHLPRHLHHVAHQPVAHAGADADGADGAALGAVVDDGQQRLAVPNLVHGYIRFIVRYRLMSFGIAAIGASEALEPGADALDEPHPGSSNS